MASYIVGRRVTLSTEVRNLAGQLTDTSMTLTMTRPDGTTIVPTVDHNGLGLYSADVTLDAAGDWLRLWAGTGAVEVTDVDQLHVIAPVLRIIGLDDAKEHRNVTSNAGDRELLDFIGAAQAMLERKVGPVVPQTITAEQHRGCGDQIALHRRPVLEVTTLAEWRNGIQVATLDPADYTLDGDAGIITLHRGWWTGEARITYIAGRRPIPEHFRLAGKELVGHMWNKSQTIRGGLRGADRATAEETARAMGYAVPHAVLEMIADDIQ